MNDYLEKIDPILYNLPALLKGIANGESIYVCEGEKDADSLNSLCYIATTCPMGAGKWRTEYTKSLNGCKKAIVIADKDEPGRKHAETVARQLKSVGIEIKVLEMPDRNGSSIKDFTDWREAGGTKEEFDQLVADTPLWAPQEQADEGSFNQLVDQYGEPYYTNRYGAICAVNEGFWAGLHYAENIELFEPTERSFYKYSNETGLYTEVTEHQIKREMSEKMLRVSRENKVPSLEKQRKNSVLNNIAAQLKGISEKRDAFVKKATFVHLGNGIIQFDDAGRTDFVGFSPSFCSRNQSPIIYCPGAKCDRFMNELLLPAVDSEGAILIQKYAGLCLLGTNLIQRLLILDGKPGTGKSTLSEILQSLVGHSNTTELRTKHLSERFELFRFRKKTLLVGVDVPGKFLSEEGAHKIKGLVGCDWFDAEQKGGTSSFPLRGDFCIIVTSNSRLQVRLDGDVGAWRRRLIIVRFEAPPPLKKIPNFGNHLIQTEGGGILNWGLEGLMLLLNDIKEHGDIFLGEKQLNIVDALLAESDSLRFFLKDCVVRDDEADLSVTEIIEAYAEYCPVKGWNPKPITVIQRELESLMLELFATSKTHSLKRDGRAAKGFRKVRLKTPENDL